MEYCKNQGFSNSTKNIPKSEANRIVNRKSVLSNANNERSDAPFTLRSAISRLRERKQSI